MQARILQENETKEHGLLKKKERIGQTVQEDTGINKIILLFLPARVE